MRIPGEPEYYDIDAYILKYSVPFDGDADSFYIQPSRCIMTSVNVDSITKPYNGKYGQLIFLTAIRAYDLLNTESPEILVKREFDSIWSKIKSMTEYINNDVNEFNDNTLPNLINSELDRRKIRLLTIWKLAKLLIYH